MSTTVKYYLFWLLSITLLVTSAVISVIRICKMQEINDVATIMTKTWPCILLLAWLIPKTVSFSIACFSLFETTKLSRDAKNTVLCFGWFALCTWTIAAVLLFLGFATIWAMDTTVNRPLLIIGSLILHFVAFPALFPIIEGPIEKWAN